MSAGRLIVYSTSARGRHHACRNCVGSWRVRSEEQIANLLREAAYEVVDFGALQPSAGNDYPDYVIPLARAVAAAEVDRGIALCGSGVGASICANRRPSECNSTIC